MIYQEYQPQEPLAAYIKCFWTLQSNDASLCSHKEKILPDGCIELIFNQADHYRQFDRNDGHQLQPRSFVHGQMREYIEIGPTGRIHIVGVRFFPHGLAPFIYMPVHELTEYAVEVVDLFGQEGATLAEQLPCLHTDKERVDMIAKFLTRRMQPAHARMPAIQYAIKQVAQAGGNYPVHRLAKELYMSERQLERIFTATVGISPKMFARISRFRDTFHVLQQQRGRTLTELAYENGYYDQAHFIRDFKAFAGVTPMQYLAADHTMNDLFTQS